MILFLLTSAIFAITLLQGYQVSAGPMWDSANALGFLTFVLLLYLWIETGIGRRQKIHQWLSYAALAALLVHVALLWIPDTTIWNYLSLDTPLYMLAGIVVFGLLLLIIIISLPTRRRYWNGDRQRFRLVHEWLAVTVLSGCLWHMIGSGFYLSALESTLLIVGSVVVWLLNKQRKWRAPNLSVASGFGVLAVAVAFVVFKWLLRIQVA